MNDLKKNIMHLYRRLLCAYGLQGWWPLIASTGRKRPGFDERGYHPGEYTAPADAAGRFEVAAGAVLTQNTAWQNVEQALFKLKKARLLTPRAVKKAGAALLRRAVRPSGYYNQKVKKLKLLAAFLLENGNLRKDRPPERDALLSVWGVGEETADSILLYAFQKPMFVIDAYTRRLLFRLGWANEKSTYRDLQALFQRHLPQDHVIYNEYHALIVTHAKRHCLKRPICVGCPLAAICVWPVRERI